MAGSIAFRSYFLANRSIEKPELRGKNRSVCTSAPVRSEGGKRSVISLRELELRAGHILKSGNGKRARRLIFPGAGTEAGKCPRPSFSETGGDIFNKIQKQDCPVEIQPRLKRRSSFFHTWFSLNVRSFSISVRARPAQTRRWHPRRSKPFPGSGQALSFPLCSLSDVDRP